MTDVGPTAVTDGALPWLRCEAVQAELGALEEQIASAVADEDPELGALASALTSRGGKRLRPALALLAARFGEGGSRADVARVAVAVELMHTATLYHDDIVDRAGSRRGAPAVHVDAGVLEAMTGGTYLSARAIELAATVGADASRLLGDTMLELCNGQLRELELAFDLEANPESYVRIISQKTASAFELACRLGAMAAGASTETVARLGRYGRQLGLAFQIADDSLDLVGTPPGPENGTRPDWVEGRYGLPLLLVLASDGPASDELRAVLQRDTVEHADVERVSMILRAAGAVPIALNIAREIAEEARRALAPLPDGPARDSLMSLALFAVVRAA